MSHDYSIQIIWSKEDGAYITAVPELPGCMADGQTMEEAIQNTRVVVGQWIESAKEEGRKVPAPLTRESLEHVLATQQRAFEAALNLKVQQAIDNAVKHIASTLVSNDLRCGREFNTGGRESFLAVRQLIGARED